MTVEHEGLRVDWLGVATLRIEASDGTVVYTDPGRSGGLADTDPRDGDLICVSHTHHYDPDAIERVATDTATLLVHEAVHHSETDRSVTPVRALPFDVRRVDAETDCLVGDVIVRTLPAYNRPDGPHVDERGDPYHPDGQGCGFLVNVDGVRVFWPGDTDVLAGHAELDVSLFCPPICGTDTMDRHEAADLAADLDPDLVVPVHYDTHDGRKADAEAFVTDLESRGIPVVRDAECGG